METQPKANQAKTSGGERAPHQEPPEPHKQARHDLFWGLGALLAFVLISLGILTLYNVSHRTKSPLTYVHLPFGERSIEIALVHTNDTWGYLDPCG